MSWADTKSAVPGVSNRCNAGSSDPATQNANAPLVAHTQRGVLVAVDGPGEPRPSLGGITAKCGDNVEFNRLKVYKKFRRIPRTQGHAPLGQGVSRLPAIPGPAG